MMKILCSILFLLLNTATIFASDTLLVTKVDQDYLTAKSNINAVPADNQLYAVYTKFTKLGDKKIPEGYIGEVYYLSKKDEELKFAYSWEGAHINMKKGFYLVPVGRIYNSDGSSESNDISLILEDNIETSTPDSEDGGLLNSILPEPTAPGGPKGLISIQAGSGVSFALLNEGEVPEALQLLLFIYSLRGGVYGQAVLNITDVFGIGVQAGIYGMTMESDYGSYTFIDIPLRAVIQLDFTAVKIVAFGGYYYANEMPGFTGIEVGGKLDLGMLYGQYAMVINDIAQTSRIEAGVSLSF